MCWPLPARHARSAIQVRECWFPHYGRWRLAGIRPVSVRMLRQPPRHCGWRASTARGDAPSVGDSVGNSLQARNCLSGGYMWAKTMAQISSRISVIITLHSRSQASVSIEDNTPASCRSPHSAGPILCGLTMRLQRDRFFWHRIVSRDVAQ